MCSRRLVAYVQQGDYFCLALIYSSVPIGEAKAYPMALAMVSQIGESTVDASLFLDSPLAANSANLDLQTSERSTRRSLRHAAMRPFSGSILPQTFLISAAQAPTPDCASAPDTKRNDKVAEKNTYFTQLIFPVAPFCRARPSASRPLPKSRAR